MSIVIHSFFDFDLSFFYLLLITFMFWGILTSYNRKKSIDVRFNWVIKIGLLIIVIAIMYINIKSFIAHVVVDKTITVKSSFEEKYNIYEKCNKLLPYNSEYKIKMIKLIEAYESKYPDKKIEFSKKILECYKDLEKYERYYNKFDVQCKIVNNSIDLIGIEEDDKLLINIEEAYNLIKNEKVLKYNYVDNCFRRKYMIKQLAENLLRKCNLIEDENVKQKLKQLAKQFYLLNIEEYEENKRYFENCPNDIDIEKEEFLNIILEYKDESIKKIKEL